MLTRLNVIPKQPTILQHEFSVKLPGYELWMNYIENALVVPARIDVVRFKDALSRSLQLYPHAAGCLHRHGDEWGIALSNHAVPIEIEQVHTALVDVKDSWVLQRNLRPFVAQRQIPPESPESTSSRLNETAESRLLLFKVTLAETESVIGVSWHHTLGDATILAQFMLSLSENYQGIDNSGHPVPSFTKLNFPTPSSAQVDHYSPYMPHLLDTCPAAELGKRYADMNAATAWIRFKIPTHRLRQLKQRVAEVLGPSGGTLSSQDVLTAYIARVIGRYSDVPITSITNAASYRHIPQVLQDANVAGNAIYVIPTILPVARASLSDTASTIRRSILRCREPTFVQQYMAVASALMLSAVNNGRCWVFAASPGKLSVNSNAAINWHSAHFGYPYGLRFHTSGLNDRYVRVFQSNPEPSKSPHSSETSEATAEHSLEVYFAVSAKIRDDVMATIESELGTDVPDFPCNIDMTAE